MRKRRKRAFWNVQMLHLLPFVVEVYPKIDWRSICKEKLEYISIYAARVILVDVRLNSTLFETIKSSIFSWLQMRQKLKKRNCKMFCSQCTYLIFWFEIISTVNTKGSRYFLNKKSYDFSTVEFVTMLEMHFAVKCLLLAWNRQTFHSFIMVT